MPGVVAGGIGSYFGGGYSSNFRDQRGTVLKIENLKKEGAGYIEPSRLSITLGVRTKMHSFVIIKRINECYFNL